jgi:hypothetical protein
MRKKLSQFTLFRYIFLPLSLVLISIVCVSSGKLMTINLSGKSLNNLVGKPRFTLTDGFELRVENIEIHDGYIRVYATLSGDNQTYSTGYFDLKLSVINGEIDADIVSLDFGGLKITGESIEKIVNFFEKELNQYIIEGNQRVDFEEIIYVRDGIQLRFRIPFAPTPTIFK